MGDGSSRALFQQAAMDHFTMAAQVTQPPNPTAWSHGGYQEESTALGTALSVEVTVPKTLAARIPGGGWAIPPTPSSPVAPPTPKPDPIEPIIDGPEFPQAMFSALRDEDPNFILPGLSDLPDNTVALLESTPQAIEAYLVGLNSALNQMLVWRGYPTDQRGTSFRQFWDVSGRVPRPLLTRIESN